MIPAIYHQGTPRSELPRPGVACTAEEDMARQEFKKEADVNYLLKKYGAGVPLRQVAYGAQEFGVDALEALERVNAAQDAFNALPEAIQEKYGDWRTLSMAIADGSFEAPVVEEVSSSTEGAEPKTAP